MSKTIIFLTSAFPYIGGEQFIETEILFYKDLPPRIILIPLSNKGDMRKIPENVEVKSFLAEELRAQNSNFLKKLLFILSALRFRDFYQEIFLNPKVLFFPRLLKALFSTVAYTHFIFRKLKDFLLRENLLNKDLVIYSYWFLYSAYAASLIKKEFPFIKVITRAHRFDLYKYASLHNHLKLKCFYATNIDSIYCISDEGRKYLIETYGFENDKVLVSRLGIVRHDYLANFNKESDTLTIVSCSYLVPVKRVDKIIEILYAYANKYPEKRLS